jgi:hypothetical protein
MSGPTINKLGQWLVAKWRARLREAGGDYFSVAKQMRKQGVPLDVALLLLCGRGVE